MVKRSTCLALLALAACNSFDSPSIVVDLRVLGMSVDPPEIVMPVDPAMPSSISPDDLGSTQVCALVADPADDRRLRYELSACPPTNDTRCHVSDPSVAIAEGLIEDPETSPDPVSLCGTLSGSADLIAVLAESVREDDLLGFGNVRVAIQLAVYPEDQSIAEAEYAEKEMRYAPELPAGRVANQNPTLERITATPVDEDNNPIGDPIDAPSGRCRDVDPPVVQPEARLRFDPIEPDGAREAYVVPTFDGGSRSFVENLSYDWYATAGKWSRRESGGPRELSGMEPPLDSKWTAPDAETTGDGVDVEMWIVQRDERGGQAWYQTCVHVAP